MIKDKISRETLERILKLFETASKDCTRRHLNGVHLYSALRDGRMYDFYAEATDGFTMSRHFFKDDIKKEYDIIISLDAKDTLKTFLKVNKEYHTFFIYEDEGVLNVQADVDREKNVVSLRLIQREYVKIDNFIPKEFGESYEVGIDIKYLNRLWKATRKDAKDTKITFKFNKNNNLNPIFVDIGDGDLNIIMPFKL
jgi:DNA polymerase III sliding clamp (beta) subunit (PCNA family)